MWMSIWLSPRAVSHVAPSLTSTDTCTERVRLSDCSTDISTLAASWRCCSTWLQTLPIAEQAITPAMKAMRMGPSGERRPASSSRARSGRCVGAGAWAPCAGTSRMLKDAVLSGSMVWRGCGVFAGEMDMSAGSPSVAVASAFASSASAWAQACSKVRGSTGSRAASESAATTLPVSSSSLDTSRGAGSSHSSSGASPSLYHHSKLSISIRGAPLASQINTCQPYTPRWHGGSHGM